MFAEEESVWMTNRAEDTLSVNAPTLFVGIDTREDCLWIVKGAVMI